MLTYEKHIGKFQNTMIVKKTTMTKYKTVNI